MCQKKQHLWGHLRPRERTWVKGLTGVTCNLILFYEWPDSADMNRSHRAYDVIEIGHNLMRGTASDRRPSRQSECQQVSAEVAESNPSGMKWH